jgi:hypothetical protein
MNGREGRVYAIAECRKYETKMTQDRVYVLRYLKLRKTAMRKKSEIDWAGHKVVAQRGCILKVKGNEKKAKVL